MHCQQSIRLLKRESSAYHFISFCSTSRIVQVFYIVYISFSNAVFSFGLPDVSDEELSFESSHCTDLESRHPFDNIHAYITYLDYRFTGLHTVSDLWFIFKPFSHWPKPIITDLFDDEPVSFDFLFNVFSIDDIAWLFHLYLVFSPIAAHMPYPWQMTFQFPASPFMYKLEILHAYIMSFLTFTVTFVLFWLFFLLVRFMHCTYTNLVNSRIAQIQHNSLLEFIWTVVPLVILLVIFSSSAALIYDGANKTNIEETISVVGNQWYWKYNLFFLHSLVFAIVCGGIHFAEHTEFDSYLSLDLPTYISEIPGTSVDAREHYPFRLFEVDRPLIIPAYLWLRFLISSSDVIHSWALPALGIKCDAVPGRINEVVSLIAVTGEYFGQCSELCGINHGFMPVHIWAYNGLLQE